MKNKLNNIHDLKLLKQKYQYDVKLHQNVLGAEFRELRHNFKESLKSTARIYTQRITAAILLNLLRKGMKQ